ncbi:MAG: STAS domain-containing protein [Thermoflexales bacterium]|nr:STAS domain-containing protein [Thermoflexales bacterium]
MEILTKEMKRVSLLTVSGRVDSNTAPDFDKALQALISAGRPQIVVDMKGVEYLSSAGLRALVSAAKAAKHSGGDVRIAQPSQRVKEVMGLAGLTAIFIIYDELVEAVGSF